MNKYQLIYDKVKLLMSNHHSLVIIPVQQSRDEFLSSYPSLSNTNILILDYDELLR